MERVPGGVSIAIKILQFVVTQVCLIYLSSYKPLSH